MECNKDLLIELVRERRNLWDQRCKDYHNRDLKTPAWNDIGAALKTEGHVVKKIWENLRDTYRRKLLAIKRLKSGDKRKAKDNWPFLGAMDFLRDVIAPRQSSGNVPPDAEESIDETNFSTNNSQQIDEFTDTPDEVSDNESQIYGDSSNARRSSNDSTNSSGPNVITRPTINQAPQHESSAQSAAVAGSSKDVAQVRANKPTESRPNKRKTTNEKFLDLENKKLELLTNKFSEKQPKKVDDADTQFLLSLHEPMQELSSLEKMKFKTDVMHLLTRAIENKNRPTTSNNPVGRHFIPPNISVNTNLSPTRSPHPLSTNEEHSPSILNHGIRESNNQNNLYHLQSQTQFEPQYHSTCVNAGNSGFRRLSDF